MNAEFVFWIVLLCGVATSARLDDHTRLTLNESGKRPIRIAEAPYQVQLLRFQLPHCAAVIISEYWALSAAHCTTAFWRFDYSIRSGTNTLNVGGYIHKIYKIINHENFMGYIHHDFDISAIKVENMFIFSDNVQPIKLAPFALHEPRDGTAVLMSGFEGTEKETEVLHQIRSYTLDIDECRDIHPSSYLITDMMLCTYNKGACLNRGNAGGAVVRKSDNTLIGIISSEPYPCKNQPVLSTNILILKKWIKKHTGL